MILARLRAGLLVAFTAALMAVVLLPLLLVVATSTSDGVLAGFPPEGFTLHWYSDAFDDQQFVASLMFSTQLAVAATLLSLLLGVPAALALARSRFPGRDLVRELLLSPVIFPALVIGLGLLQMFAALRWQDARINLLLAHGVICAPYVVRTVTASLSLIDPALEEAARTLGATRWRVFRRVVLPQIGSGVAAGAVFAFMVSFDEFPVSLWLANSRYEPLSLLLFDRIQTVFDPSVAAISTVMIAVGVVVVAVLERLVGLRRAMTV